MAGPTIFINYRRDDAVGHAGRLYDRLAAEFGEENVFRDIDGIDAGEDFVDAINEAIGKCDVLLALIGPRWLTATDGQGNWRLANKNDLVRVEIVTALTRGIRVIPVLLQDTPMPRPDDLPAELRKLSLRNAVEVRDTQFDADTAGLIADLAPRWRHRLHRYKRRWPVLAALALLLVSVPTSLAIMSRLTITPEQARGRIARMGVTYDPQEFVRAAGSNEPTAGRLVELFLRAGMDPNTTDSDGTSALFWAIARGHPSSVKALLAANANPAGALQAAAANGKLDAASALLQRDTSAESREKALERAALNHEKKMVELLLDDGVDVNAGNGAALIAAAEHDDAESLDVVKLLIARGANVKAKSNDGWTALHAAAEGEDPNNANPPGDIARLLIEKGADVNASAAYINSGKGWTPLLVAIWNKRPAIAQLLLDAGADANAQAETQPGESATRTALMLTAKNGLGALVDPLLAKGASIDARNKAGSTNLIVAASEFTGREVTLRLVEKGADVNAANTNGSTALMYAVCSHTDVAVELLKRGANANARDKDGETALMRAAYCGQEQSIPKLLAAGAQLDTKRNDGRTALMLAAERGFEDVARSLLSAGANARITDRDGLTALDIARKAGDDDTISVLSGRTRLP